MLMQSLIQAIYPPHCIACAAPTDMEHGLCGACWPQTKFITGTICDKSGVPLPGDAEGDIVHCDDCMRIARPWDRGWAALAYADVGRACAWSQAWGSIGLSPRHVAVDGSVRQRPLSRRSAAGVGPTSSLAVVSSEIQPSCRTHEIYGANNGA